MYKVKVVITTYNLEKYIAQALDSVLMQKTKFDFKIIVADDCSQDNTIEILKKYQNNNPEKIEIVLAESNMGSLANSDRVFDGLQCEYFSFLDGDDYWIGEEHLQKQVDYMDAHSECMLCGGNTQYLRNNTLCDLVVGKDKTGRVYSFDSLLKDDIPFVHTSALLVRNSIFINGLPECYKEAENTFENCALRGEDFRRILHLELGNMYIMDEVLSVYRIHSKGMWQGSTNAKRAIEGAIGDNFYRKYFGNKYGSYFTDRARDSYRSMMTTLVLEYGLLGDYKLSAKETELLNSLFMDLKKDTLESRSISRVKRKVLRIIIKKFFI